jgi:hypothetical protein
MIENKAIADTHPTYDDYITQWEFFLRSYLGGQHYSSGEYLTQYVSEGEKEYNRRVDLTPMDNHCKNIIHIYSSYLWRVPPTRSFDKMAGDPALESFLKDADLDGRSFDSVMRQAQIWSSVYGHVWLMMDKPQSQAGTRAEELDQDIRPYVTMFTPENVFDWKYKRSASGRFQLEFLKIREEVNILDNGDTETHFREWTKDEVRSYRSSNDTKYDLEVVPNTLGRIPAVFLPANRSNIRGIGISDLTDVAPMQRAIYQELSEVEQLIRISNHPTLVKTFETDASAGAGAVINLPDDMDANLRPYQMQPSGQNLDAVRNAIGDKVEAINRMAHMGAVRGSEAVKQSGIALQTEFQMLNAKLSEKADLLELAEEQLWGLYCDWQGHTGNIVEVFYPDSFDLRDYDKELVFLQQLRATGVKSTVLAQEIDKKIADLLLDDENLARAHVEIEASTTVVGDYSEKTQIYSYHMDNGVVTANEVREKIGLEDVAGGDELLKPKVSQPSEA